MREKDIIAWREQSEQELRDLEARLPQLYGDGSVDQQLVQLNRMAIITAERTIERVRERLAVLRRILEK